MQPSGEMKRNIFSFKILFVCLFYVSGCFVHKHISVPHVCTKRSEEDVGSFRTGGTHNCELPCGCRWSNLVLCKSSQGYWLLSHLSSFMNTVYILKGSFFQLGPEGRLVGVWGYLRQELNCMVQWRNLKSKHSTTAGGVVWRCWSLAPNSSDDLG